MRLLAGLLLTAVLGAPARAAEYPLPPPPPEPHVTFSADHFDYDAASATVHLKGKVLVKESTWTLKAEELWIDTAGRRAKSQGYMLLEDGYSAIYGERGEFNLITHEGWLDKTKGGHGEWNVSADRVTADADQTLRYEHAVFTSCDDHPSHFKFRSSKAKVVPKKYLLSYNNVFYLGNYPVFYFPILYKPIWEKHWLHNYLQPGYDRRNGGFVKTSLNTEWSPYHYTRLFMDYYTSQGFGYGGELHHRKEDSRGVISGYHIRETSTHEDRWSVIADQFQQLPSSFSFQGRFQVQSDADFNNNYARSSSFRVTPELINNAAVNYRFSNAVARVSYSRVDRDDGTRRRWVKSRESTPRLDYQTSPLRWGNLPWLNTVTGFADNNFDVGRTYQERSVGLGWEGTRTFLPGRGVSLTPKIGLGETYLNRYDSLTSLASTDTLKDAYLARYKTEMNMRVDTLIGAWDLTQFYNRRMKPNTFQDDAGALDHGVETNLTTLQDTFRPARKVLVRVGTGYDWRKFRNRDVGFRRRVEPIVAELGYTPRPDLDLSVRNDYQLEDGNRSFLVSGTWGDIDRNFVTSGVSYNLSDAQRTFLNLEGGWVPPWGCPPVSSTATAAGTPFKPEEHRCGWRFGGAVRSEILSTGGLSHIHDYRAFEKEVIISKVFHDFVSRAMIRFRPGGVREVFFRVEMRLASLKPDRVIKKDWESEWFPERKRGLEDRP